MPKVSIIIPTRNRAALLPRAVESARRSGSDLEIIVVDDASEDQTPEVCAGWPDLRCIRVNRRCGLGGARNLGIMASAGEYISFLDDDDVRLPGSIDRQLKVLETDTDAGLVYGRALHGDAHGQANGSSYPSSCAQGDVFWELMHWNFIPCPSVIFRRACLLSVGLLDESAPGLEDWDLWIRIAELYRVLAVEEAVSIWRQPSTNSGQFTSHPEKMLWLATQLHGSKWMRLPRAIQADPKQRARCTALFADRISNQLIWEVAARLKNHNIIEFMRIASVLVSRFPFISVKKTFRQSTWRFLQTGWQKQISF